ncbi:hypothetical protein QT972_11020 [Microcoleus sp. herbarium7]|uniref:hypothetical protein n=1 Tax=Microcoleus sp. herbarium7 TaxID=3055435 RepID=UPI002FCED691
MPTIFAKDVKIGDWILGGTGIYRIETIEFLMYDGCGWAQFDSHEIAVCMRATQSYESDIQIRLGYDDDLSAGMLGQQRLFSEHEPVHVEATPKGFTAR